MLFWLPSYDILLKVGIPIMLLRNLSFANMCNGTWLLIKELRENIIMATILTGLAEGHRLIFRGYPWFRQIYPYHFKGYSIPSRSLLLSILISHRVKHFLWWTLIWESSIFPMGSYILTYLGLELLKNNIFWYQMITLHLI